MILGIGVDSVEIVRFAHWHTYDRKKLLRIFSKTEIDYCLAAPAKSAERFAVRFAAREALFKALSAHWPDHSIPFLSLCHAVTILKKPAPEILINWNILETYGITCHAMHIHLSMTHARQLATSLIILELL